MAFFKDKNGVIQHVELDARVYKAAAHEKKTVPEYLNSKYAADADFSAGTPFSQLCASEGIMLPGANDFGIRPGALEDVLEGRMNAANVTNVGQQGNPFGNAARSLFPVAIIDIIENKLTMDYAEDPAIFDRLIGTNIAITGDSFIQPVVNYGTKGGPEQAKAQRVTQFAEPGNILQIGTSEINRSLPAHTIGIEYSDKAEKALTIDVIALTIARYIQVERNERVYTYLNSLFVGDNDLISGAVPTVQSSSLDPASTGGVLTHRAWVKFLGSQRRYRKITHVILDVDTYLKVEGRVGRPGTNNYDPTLARFDPQIRPMVPGGQGGFGNDVVFFLVDPASEGGPVPANTIWAIDQPKAITRVRSVTGDYSAQEAFALRRATALRWDWQEAVYRTHGDTELRPFASLTISS